MGDNRGYWQVSPFTWTKIENKKSSIIPKFYTMKGLTLVDVSTKGLFKIQSAWWFLYQLKVRFSPEWVAQN